MLDAAVRCNGAHSGLGSGTVDGYTDLFIHPGYRFTAVDGMITNFHLPETSLLLLVAAFIADRGTGEPDAAHGIAETKRIYEHAIKQKYRFYSFGDAMLIL